MKILDTRKYSEKLKIRSINVFNLTDPEKTVYEFFPENRNELIEIITNQIDKFGYDCDLNNIDVSHISDMSWLFAKSEDYGYKDFYKFCGDISKWDVSNVYYMNSMFRGNESFNGDISKWNVSNVKDMSIMFRKTTFNGDISKWNVSNVRTMYSMFSFSNFDGDISNWNVGKVITMEDMFDHSFFNRDLSKWDVSNVINMSGMFEYSMFEGDISSWNVDKVYKKQFMFRNSRLENKPYKQPNFLNI